MLKPVNIHRYQNIYFQGTKKIKLPKDLISNLDAFKNKMLADEEATYGYIIPEVRTVIESKIQTLKTQAQNINPKNEAQLIRPLQAAIKGNYDITATYLALGEFEKTLSNI